MGFNFNSVPYYDKSEERYKFNSPPDSKNEHKHTFLVTHYNSDNLGLEILYRNV